MVMTLIRYSFIVLLVCKWISISGFRIFNLPFKKYENGGLKTNLIQQQQNKINIKQTFRYQPIYANNKYPSEEKYVSQEINMDDDEFDDDGNYNDNDDYTDGMSEFKDPRQNPATRNE